VCNGITEFEDERVEEIQEEIAARHGFRLRSHKHELYGVCPSCQAKGS
jgi:Fur family ferric uptake transcriptional regulator